MRAQIYFVSICAWLLVCMYQVFSLSPGDDCCDLNGHLEMVYEDAAGNVYMQDRTVESWK